MASTPTKKSRSQRNAKDRDSHDIEDCFTSCQDQGFHRDPDVYLGSAANPNVNQFSVLEDETSCPSNPLDTRDHKFTFFYPSPCSTSLPPASSPALTPPSSGKLLLTRREIPTSSRSGLQKPPSSAPLPSTPTTPPSKPIVRLPLSLPKSASPSQYSQSGSSCPGYLDGIKIPSPLLYHKRSQELLTRSSDSDINAELARTFLLTCGQDLPEPDFESYKDFEDVPRSPKPVISAQDTSLQLFGPEWEQQLTFHNIPCAPWIAPTPARTIDNSIELEVNTGTAHGMGTKRALSDDRRAVFGFSKPMHSGHEPRPESWKASKLQALDELPGLAQQTQSVDSDRTERTDFIDDDPVTVFRRWNAFENVIHKPLRVDTKSSPRVSISLLKEAIDVGHGQRSGRNTTSSLSRCMALSLARLYEHQYLGWPRRLAHEPEYKSYSYPILHSSVLQTLSTPSWLKMQPWIQQLNIDDRRDIPCRVTDDTRSSFDKQFTIHIEDDDLRGSQSGSHNDDDSLSPSAETEAIEIEDESYITALESTTEIAHEEAFESDDESWHHWTWDEDGWQEDKQSCDDTNVDVLGFGWRL